MKIITLAEGEIGALHVGLKGTMSALYLTDIAISATGGRFGFAIELVGEIANMVRLSSSGREGREISSYRSSVTVVAGVGFELTTFRL